VRVPLHGQYLGKSSEHSWPADKNVKMKKMTEKHTLAHNHSQILQMQAQCWDSE